MMDEFSVLLDEHRAMHACANQLMEVAGLGRDHEEIAELLRPLAWMASCVHAPKENTALIERLVGEALANAGVARLMEDRSRVEENLRNLSGGGTAMKSRSARTARNWWRPWRPSRR